MISGRWALLCQTSGKICQQSKRRNGAILRMKKKQIWPAQIARKFSKKVNIWNTIRRIVVSFNVKLAKKFSKIKTICWDMPIHTTKITSVMSARKCSPLFKVCNGIIWRINHTSLNAQIAIKPFLRNRIYYGIKRINISIYFVILRTFYFCKYLMDIHSLVLG